MFIDWSKFLLKKNDLLEGGAIDYYFRPDLIGKQVNIKN